LVLADFVDLLDVGVIGVDGATGSESVSVTFSFAVTVVTVGLIGLGKTNLVGVVDAADRSHFFNPGRWTGAIGGNSISLGSGVPADGSSPSALFTPGNFADISFNRANNFNTSTPL
jgi:hypothetical protein